MLLLYKPNMRALSSLLPSLLSSLMFVQLAPSLGFAMTAVAYRRCAYIISNADIGFARPILICISPIDLIALATRWPNNPSNCNNPECTKCSNNHHNFNNYKHAHICMWIPTCTASDVTTAIYDKNNVCSANYLCKLNVISVALTLNKSTHNCIACTLNQRIAHRAPTWFPQVPDNPINLNSANKWSYLKLIAL